MKVNERTDGQVHAARDGLDLETKDGKMKG